VSDRMAAFRVDVEVRSTLVPTLDWTPHPELERRFRSRASAERYASRQSGHGLAAEYRTKICPASRPRDWLDVAAEFVRGPVAVRWG
jgi:hypothetical protein